MLKKAKAQHKSGKSGSAKDLSQGVLNSSHQIWLAGLGAFARAQEEGSKVFDALVKHGERFQDRTRRVATETAAAARGAATAKAKEMQQMAGGTWDKLEQVFEDRVARALSKLGVYTQNDVQQLAARVDHLAAAIGKLHGVGGGKRVAASSKKAPATKRAVRRARKPGKARKASAA